MIDAPIHGRRRERRQPSAKRSGAQNRMSEKTLKRDDLKAGRLQKDCGLGRNTLKGKKAEERRLICLTAASALTLCPVKSR